MARRGLGIYCVRAPALDSGKVSAAVSVDEDATTAGDAKAKLRRGQPGSFDCPNASDFAVVTTEQKYEYVPVNETTRILVALPEQVSDGVGFQLVIP